MRAFPRLGLAGLLSIFPLGTSQSDPRTLEQEMKEVAELAMRCGIREEVEWTRQSTNAKFTTVIYTLNIPYKYTAIPYKHIDTFTMDYSQKEPYFIFEDGNFKNTPNNKIDKGDNLTVRDGRGVRDNRVGYGCLYGVEGHIDHLGMGCRLDDEDLISPTAEDVRKILKELKEKQYMSCHIADEFACFNQYPFSQNRQ